MNLESTHGRIGPKFLVICSGFWRFWKGRRGLSEQLINGISRARQSLILKPVLVNLESTYVRIGPNFSIIFAF